MEHSTVTSKGQVTIPAEIRKQLGIQPGDQVNFVREGNKIYLVRQEDRVEAAFGLFKAAKTATLEDMDAAIAAGWKQRGHD